MIAKTGLTVAKDVPLMTTFNDLGEDIIASNLSRYLTTQETFNLSLTCKQLYAYLSSNDAYHVLFLNRFGKLTPLNLKQYNWEYLFKKRSDNALNLYTWGSGNQGRLGYLLRDIPEHNRAQLYFGVHTPTLVPNFKSSVIEQIHAGGYSFQILSNGQIYCIGAGYGGGQGVSTPGPLHDDFQLHIYEESSVMPPSFPIRNFARDSELPAGSRRRADNPNLRLPPDQLNFPPELGRRMIEESSFVTRMRLPSSFNDEKRAVTHISSGRKHFLALDEGNRIYTWDSGNSDWKGGVEVIFPGLHGHIKSICAGWNLSSCFISGVGIIVWYSRDSVTKEDYEACNFRVRANYVVVPDLKSIIDYITLQDCVIYIRHDGDIYRFHLNASALANSHEDANETIWNSPLKLFNSWLSNYNKENKAEASFTKLSGCYKSFAVFTNYENVLLGNLNSDDEVCEPVMPDQLQKRGIIQIAIGDYHYLALTDKGKLLSWGLESQQSGCLGLGRLLESSDSSVITENRNHQVLDPHEIKRPSPGKWLAVATSGWHAGGLFIADSVCAEDKA